MSLGAVEATPIALQAEASEPQTESARNALSRASQVSFSYLIYAKSQTFFWPCLDQTAWYDPTVWWFNRPEQRGYVADMKRREEMTFLERAYFWEVFKGLLVTGGHLTRNFFRFVISQIGLGFRSAESKPWATYQYPDEARPYAARFRGRHRLTLQDDGTLRCTSCFLCATACPAKCIYIEPAEHADPKVEKFPHRYEIDTLLCIYCGYCVEACPVDAIRMDTGIHPEIYPPDPRAFIEDKETLMLRSRFIDDNGPKALVDEHMARMRRIEKRPFEAPY